VQAVEAIAALRANAAALGLPIEEAGGVEAAYRAAGREGYWRRLIEELLARMALPPHPSLERPS
jgi:hypothetical protein